MKTPSKTLRAKKKLQDFCPPEQSSLKSFFLGPQAENGDFLKSEVAKIFEDWIDWRKHKFPQDGKAIPKREQESQAFQDKLHLFHHEVMRVSNLFKEEIPKFSPRYIGHMVSEFSMPALLGHIITLLHNPNNISQEVSKVGVKIEESAIRDLGLMLGYKKNCVGHFTSGGTIANFESVVRAKARWIHRLYTNQPQTKSLLEASYRIPTVPGDDAVFEKSLNSDFLLNPWIEKNFKVDFAGPMILLPSSSHYSWTKAASFFGLGAKGLKVVAADHFGLMDIRALKNEIELSLKTKTPIISVVSICGTTELGTVDRIEAIQDILDSYRKKEGFDLWHHVDAAYGGYFATVKEIRDPAVSPELRRSLKAISRSTSVTIDPHKLGYVPYSSGAFICREKKDYYLTESLPPYVAFERHHDPGPYTMEGSRSAAGAVATYLTSRCIGLDAKGYGSVILRSLHNTRLLKEELQAVQIPVLFVESEITNILCFAVGSRESSLSELNHQTRKAIKYFERHAKNSFFISKTVLGQNFSALLGDFCLRYDLVPDEDHLVVIRLTLMNPFTRSKHSKTDYIGEFIRTLSKAIASI